MVPQMSPPRLPDFYYLLPDIIPRQESHLDEKRRRKCLRLFGRKCKTRKVVSSDNIMMSGWLPHPALDVRETQPALSDL